MSLSLEGIGAVRLDSPAGPLFLTARGSRWNVALSRRAAGRELWRLAGALPAGRRRTLAALGAVLEALGVGVAVIAGERTLLVIGRGSGGGALSRWLVGSSVEVCWGGCVRFLLGRSAAVRA